MRGIGPRVPRMKFCWLFQGHAVEASQSDYVRLAINETYYTHNKMINIFRDMFNLLGLFLYTSGFVLKMFTPACMPNIMR